jgi:hypothetical protein
MLNLAVGEGFQALKSRQMDAANGALDRGRNLVSQNRNLNTRALDSLKMAIDVAEIAELMQQAEMDHKAGKINEAFAGLELAERRMDENRLEKGAQFIKSASMISKPIALQKINALNGSNNLDEEIKILGEFVARYHLENDDDVNKAMGPYRQELQNRMCQSLQQQIADYEKQYERELGLKNYIRAEDACSKAISLTEKYPDCKLQAGQLSEKRTEILPAAVYQKMMNQILEMQSKNQTEEIVKKYTEAEKYFYQFNLEEKGLKYKPLEQFASDNFRTSGLMYLAKYFREQGELKKSLNIYQLLLNREGSSSKFSGGLYDLGKAYGERDKKAGVSGKASELSRMIAGRDSALRPFYEGYEDSFTK